MPDPTAAAMRLSSIALERVLQHQELIGRPSPVPIAHMIEQIAHALDDAGVREAVEKSERGCNMQVASTEKMYLLAMIKGHEKLHAEVLAALTGSKEKERRNAPTAYSPVPGPPVNPQL